ncbi:phosphonatase-like hydrolase [Rhodococcus globerulus]|uniref:Phosphonatase-like hydrolase n=1 Tax=Nocardia globerula TaxID=1818 RepID=A0A652YM77_NOCGL|nr:phosphonatase-like hydrolase [Rhodococcus globerulus]NMD62145.1 phosphonatase-like hydrolase [Nocardia globerula]PVX65766.1 phosphonatase-like hydrolase [Rhodococcus globerulus]
MTNSTATQALSETSLVGPAIELVVMDMAGTTVADDGLVIDAFDAAATAVGLAESGADREDARRYVLETMGQSKIEVFRALFGAEDRAQAANHAFEAAYDARIDGGVTSVPGAADAITQLREAGVAVVLTTGFAPATQHRILDALEWHTIADGYLAPGDSFRGRPHPDLVLAAALQCRVSDMAAVAVVGDTASDIRSGRRAGASVVAGVRTGAHRSEVLIDAGATHILDSITDLPSLVLR